MATGQTHELVPVREYLHSVGDLLVADGRLFWSDTIGIKVLRLPDGKPALVTAQGGEHLAASAKHLFWIDGQQIGYVPLAGGTPSFIQPKVSGLFGAPTSVAGDGENIYWTAGSGHVIRTNIVSGASSVLAEMEGSDSIILDDSSIYWLTGDAVMRRDK